jgi:hypothetical protein
MHRTAFVFPLVLGILSASVASAEEPTAQPSAAPTTAPQATPATSSEPPAESAPIAPTSAKPPAESAPVAPPPAEKKGGRAGYVAGGVVSLAAGIPLMIAGGALLSAKGPSGNCGGFGCLDFSGLDHVTGGITMGFGAAGVLAGTILLGVAISRSSSSPDAEPKSAVPVVTVGLGQASARWTF